MAGAEPSSSGTFIIGGTTIGGANSKKPSDALSLDYCTFRVPYEDLNIRYRQGQKKLDLAAHLTSKAANLLTKKVHGSNEPISQDALRKNFDILLKQVQDAKEAFANSMDACIEYSDKISFRCDKLEEEFTDDERAANMEIDAERAEKSRFGRYIAWHLLRCGMIESAKRLIEELGLDGMMDVEIFERIYEVEQAIHARNTKPCIEWCEFNRSRLKRIGSRMEIVARQQDVVTFIEEGNVIDAVNYVKSYVTPITKKKFAGDLTKLMGAIVCPIEESRIRNPEYHAPDRYQQCAQLFVKEAYRLYGFESSSAMEQLIQMGLATQKTPCCKPDLETPLNKQKCMVCRPDMYPLAEGLPYAHVDNSRILCSMTGTVVDDDENIPFLFPSGHVFGLKAINKLRRPENKIFDPIHKQMMDESEALRLYFL